MSGTRLAGKRALITGAAGGLGQAMARRMAEQGCHLALTDIDAAAVQALADQIRADFPGQAHAYTHDVTSEAAWVEVVGRAAEDMGGLSVLVNNAGIGGDLVFAEGDTVEHWQRQFEINLRSVMLGCKHALPFLRASAPASIINVSSIAGLTGAPGMGAYNATKAGVWLYTKTVALEAAKLDWNVRCNSVHPAFVLTPILDTFVAHSGGDEARAHERLARGIPLKRIGEPDDVAWCVIYLASDESKFVTGAEFRIDGGLTAQ